MSERSSTLLRCRSHDAVAGWECTACHEVLCPDCAALKVVPPTTLVACTKCGEFAEPLIRRKGDTASLRERIPGAFRFPFTTEGLAVWLGLSLVAAVLGIFNFELLGWVAALGSFFGLTRSTARGNDHFELSDFQDPLQSVVMPLVRFGVAMLPAWGGSLLAGYLHMPWLHFVAIAVAVLWSPTAYIGAATHAGLVDLLNPIRVLGATARLGKDYAVYVAALAAVVVAMFLSFLVAMFTSHYLVVPVLGPLVTQAVLLYPPLVGARIAGFVLMIHGSVFGWNPLDSWEPILGDVVPRGQPLIRESLPKHLPTSIELPPEVVPVPAPATVSERFAALEINPDAPPPPEVAPLDVALLPTHAVQAADEIRRAIRERKAEVALDGFRATGLTSAGELQVEELLWLGQTAAAHIDYECAELAFTRASERKAPAEPVSRAKVMLGRLLSERLKRADEARRWMERAVADHPGTSAAEYAAKWLRELPASGAVG